MTPELIRELVVWVGLAIGSNLGGDMTLPRVLVVSPLEVAQEVGRPPSTFIRALYDKTRELVVVNTDDCESVGSTCRAILVHELVHHYIHKSGFPVRCHGEEEKVAYTTAYRWVLEHAPEIMANVALDPMTFIFATGCEEMP